MNSPTETNRELWNGWTRIHARSELYDLEGFRRGEISLKEIELAELGDVNGKRLLHLQCHFGLDTMSWARLGATVTGVDISDEAIELARSLSSELNIPADFIRSDLYDLPDVLDGQFDVVFTSYGALCWLRDLDQWARVVARYLAPGGIFYVAEFHPVLTTLDDAGTPFSYRWLRCADPITYEAKGTYADPDAEFCHQAYEWPFGVGDVVTALASAGLRIDYLHEFPYSVYGCFPFLEESDAGHYVARNQTHACPHLFSIKATRIAPPPDISTA